MKESVAQGSVAGQERITPSSINTLLEEPILIIEDSEEISMLYASYCKRLGLKCEFATNGEDGLKKAQAKLYSLFIVDLMMPVMDGKTFTQKLKEIQPDACIIIETAIDESQAVIDVMKLGVFDYLIKPIHPDSFFKSIKKAADRIRTLKTEKEIDDIGSKQLREQLEWLTFKEAQRKSTKESWEISSLYSLKTSLSQGSGIGALITLLDILKLSQKESDEGYLVSKEIMDMIYSNQQAAKNILTGISDLLDIVNRDAKLEPMSAGDLIDQIKEKAKALSPILQSRNLTFSFSELKSNPSLEVERGSLLMAIEEILLNASKYCSLGTRIDVYSSVVQGYFCIAVKNLVDHESRGIEEKYEDLVVQPFFRVLPPVEDAADLERFGFGLGLTAVDHIAHKHNGMFFIHNAKDHTSDTVKMSVISELFLPLNG